MRIGNFCSEKKTIKSKVKEEKEEPVEDVEAKEPISEIRLTNEASIIPVFSENIENQEKKNYVGKSKVDMATQEERVVFLRYSRIFFTGLI